MISTSDLTVTRATPADHDALRRMVQLYSHDFSEFDGADVDEHGLFAYPELERFWLQPHHAAYVLRVAQRPAGFALVSNNVIGSDADHWLDEFFVLRKYRRAGIGRAAAARIFDLHPGRWELGQLASNPAATAFWRAVLAGYTQGDFQHIEVDDDDWRGSLQRFRAGHLRRP